MTTEQHVTRILLDIACKSPEGVTASTKLDDLGLESLDRVEALSEIEVSFGISLLDDEAANAVTIADVVDLVEAKVTQ